MALARHQFSVTDELGNIVAGARVEVRREGPGQPLIQLYSDRDGTSAIGNPFTIGDDGYAAFHVSGGAYQIKVSKGAFTRTWRYVGIGTASENDFGAQFAAREVLVEDRTYYVRTDGSDFNNGLANSSSGAFLTLQKAWDTILTTDLSGFAVTVQVGAGTYTQGVDMNTAPLGGLVSWIGDVTTPSNVLISTTGDDCFAMLAATTVSIKGFKLQTTTSGWGIINNGGGGQINYGNIDFGACATGHMRSSAYGALWNINNGNCTISGGAPNHFWAGPLGNIVASAYTTTLVGTPNFSDSFARARDGALIAPGLTFSGSATGVRYIVDQLGNMSIAGGGASYFPGSVAGSGGSTSGGGSYA